MSFETTSELLIKIFPSSGFNDPDKIRDKVDLPQPFFPYIPTMHLSSILREKLFKTLLFPKDLQILLISIIIAVPYYFIQLFFFETDKTFVFSILTTLIKWTISFQI